MVIEFLDECEPLFDCAKNGHSPLVELLISRYKEALELEEDNENEGEAEDMDRLSDWISENRKDRDELGEEERRTPLWYAISQGHFEVVRLLVEAGCKIDKEAYEICLSHRWTAAGDCYTELKKNKEEHLQVDSSDERQRVKRTKNRRNSKIHPIYPIESGKEEEIVVPPSEAKPRAISTHQTEELMTGNGALLGGGGGTLTASEGSVTTHSPMHTSARGRLVSILKLSDDDEDERDIVNTAAANDSKDRAQAKVVGRDEIGCTAPTGSKGVAKEEPPLASSCLKVKASKARSEACKTPFSAIKRVSHEVTSMVNSLLVIDVQRRFIRSIRGAKQELRSCIIITSTAYMRGEVVGEERSDLLSHIFNIANLSIFRSPGLITFYFFASIITTHIFCLRLDPNPNHFLMPPT